MQFLAFFGNYCKYIPPVILTIATSVNTYMRLQNITNRKLVILLYVAFCNTIQYSVRNQLL